MPNKPARLSAAHQDVATGDVLRFPSGNRNHPGREHSFLVAIVLGSDVLAVPICTWRGGVGSLVAGSLPTCLIQVGDIDRDIVKRPSFADYFNTRPLTQASIRSQVDRGRLRVTRFKPSWGTLVGRVTEGLRVSPDLNRSLKAMLP